MSRRSTERPERPGQTVDRVLHVLARLLVLCFKQRPHRWRSLDESARVRDDRWTSPLAPHGEGQLENRVGVRCRVADQVSPTGKVEFACRYRSRPGQGEHHAWPFKPNIFDCGEPLDDTEVDVELVERGPAVAEITAGG